MYHRSTAIPSPFHLHFSFTEICFVKHLYFISILDFVLTSIFCIFWINYVRWRRRTYIIMKWYLFTKIHVMPHPVSYYITSSLWWSFIPLHQTNSDIDLFSLVGAWCYEFARFVNKNLFCYIIFCILSHQTNPDRLFSFRKTLSQWWFIHVFNKILKFYSLIFDFDFFKFCISEIIASDEDFKTNLWEYALTVCTLQLSSILRKSIYPYI